MEPKKTIRVLLYGQPGVCKTTLGLSAPNPALIDFDGGVHRVNPAHQAPTLQVNSYGEYEELLQSGELAKFDTLIVDTAGKMLDYMDMVITNGVKRGLKLQEYGRRKAMFRSMLSHVSSIGKHIIFIAHEKEDKDGDTKIVRPDIGGSSTGDLIRELDLVGYIQMIGNKRTISFNPNEKFYGKNTCNLEPVINIPVLLDENGIPIAKNYLMTTIIDKFVATQQARINITARYEALLSQIEGMICEADIDGLNTALVEIPKMEVIWDSSLRARRMITERARDINAVFDRETKQYVEVS